MSLDLAQQVLDLVRERAGGHAQAQASVQRQALGLTRFANSFIHQNVADQITTVGLRLHTGGRTVAATSTVTTLEGLRELVIRTVEAARLAPLDPGWPGLAPPEPVADQAGFDEPTAGAGPQARAARVRAFIDAAGGLPAAGYCRTLHWTGAFANTAGHAVTGQTTEAAMDGIARAGAAGPSLPRDGLRGPAGRLARDPRSRPAVRYGPGLGGSDGVARLASARLADLDGAVLGARAAAKARGGADPVELPPGRYEVVLEPPAVADLLQNLAAWGFDGRALAERRSFVELGTAQFDQSVSLVDDPFAPGSPGFPYDDDGTPRRRLTLVDAGVTAAVAHDRRTAALVGGGAVSTGHAVRVFGKLAAVPTNLHLLPGEGGDTDTDAAKSVASCPAPEPAGISATRSARLRYGPGQGIPMVDPAAAELVPRVSRGLLVTDLWYTRVLDPKTLVMTGLTRNGVWLIEDGEVTTPVRNLRFTQSYPQGLGPGAVLGIGPVATRLPGSYGVTWPTAPALHLASWQITGGASG